MFVSPKNDIHPRKANNVLVIAAHPDDEILGCGGTIARHRALNDHVDVLIMGQGVTSRSEMPENRQNEATTELRQCAQRANAILDVNDLVLLNYPDNRMDGVDLLDIVRDIEAHIATRSPNIVYTHHYADVNIDHRRVHDAVITACRPQPGNSVRQLLFFEVPSSTEWRPPVSLPAFAPNWYVNISETLQVKLEALLAYHLELREYPHPRSLMAVEYLARWRGASVGVSAAEAFELGRIIL